MSRQSETMAKLTVRRKAGGLCVKCGKPRDCRSKCLCLECLDRARDQYRSSPRYQGRVYNRKDDLRT